MAEVWNATDGSPAGRRMSHGGAIHSAVLTDDGKMVVTAGDDGNVRIWNVPEPITDTDPKRLANSQSSSRPASPWTTNSP